MFSIRSAAGIAGSAVVAGLLAVPAVAGPEWGDPQEVSSRYGWQVSLSDDGKAVAWIRVGKRPGPGPVRTEKYKSRKKVWTSTPAVGGSAESTEVVLSGDGDTLLIKAPTGYRVSTRKGTANKWTRVATLADGSDLQDGSLSADGDTAVWVVPCKYLPPDGSTVPGKVLSRQRAADGSWGPEAVVGDFVCAGIYGSGRRLALSADGSTVAWLNASQQLVAAAKAADGSWGAPALIQQYSQNRPIGYLQLSADGSRVVWQSGGTAVLTSTRSSAGWADPTYVMQDDVSSVAMSPNGKVVAYGQLGPGRLRVRSYEAGEWSKPKTLGPSQLPQIVVRNKAVAWVEQERPASALRVSVLRKGTWGTAMKVAPKALSPALSRKGDTLAYAGAKAGGIFSVKR